jgi:large subunit ribosomal protein L30
VKAKAHLKIKQIRSCIGVEYRMVQNLKGLGLGRIGREVVVANTPSFRGAVKKVLHLVSVEECEVGNG